MDCFGIVVENLKRLGVSSKQLFVFRMITFPTTKPGYSSLISFIPHVSTQIKFYMTHVSVHIFVVGTLIIHSGRGSGAMLVERIGRVCRMFYNKRCGGCDGF